MIALNLYIKLGRTDLHNIESFYPHMEYRSINLIFFSFHSKRFLLSSCKSSIYFVRFMAKYFIF